MKHPRYYPIYLDLEGCDALVVGGGTIAERKVLSLLEAGARVRVVSPAYTTGIRRLAKKGSIKLTVRSYRTSDIRGARVVIGSTNNPSVNAQVFDDCESRGILVNIVDDPAHCRFIVPATFTRGPIRVAVATGGGAPGVSALLRERLEQVIHPQHAWLVDQLRKRRPLIRKLQADRKALFWKWVKKLSLARAKSSAVMGNVIENLLRKAQGAMNK